jgi:hypothetical protein
MTASVAGGIAMYPKARLDALHDGIFSVAMTLLDLEQGAHLRAKQMGALLLVISALLTIALSVIDPRIAMWGLALNFVQPVIARWARGRLIPD